jgi:ATP-binding cassette subfamily B protein
MVSLAKESKSKSLSLAKVHPYLGHWCWLLLELVIWSWSTLVAWCILMVQSKYRYNCWIYFVNMLTWPVASLGWVSSMVQEAEASQNVWMNSKNWTKK